MNSEQIKDMHLLYNAVYNEELREQFDEYNNTIYDEDIVEVATEYFYSYGLNEDGIGILIEKVGLESFVEYVYDLSEDLHVLTEARARKKYSGPSYDEVKAGIDAREAKARAKKEAKKKASEAASEKKETERAEPESRGVESQAKAEQPKSKKPERSGIARAISGAVDRAKRDTELLKKSWNTAREVGRGHEANVAKAAGTVVGAAHGAAKVAHRLGQEAGKSETGKKIKKVLFGEEVEAWVNQLVEEGYDLSDYTWDEMAEIYEQNINQIEEGIGSLLLKGGKALLPKLKNIGSMFKKVELPPAKAPMSANAQRASELRAKYNIGPERSDTSPKMQILNRTKNKVDLAQREVNRGNASNSYVNDAKAVRQGYLDAGNSKYGGNDAAGRRTLGGRGSTDTPDPSGPGSYHPSAGTPPGDRGRGGKAFAKAQKLNPELTYTQYSKELYKSSKKPSMIPMALNNSYEHDVFDTILEYLIVEGYAESVEQAEVIMVNMSEDWRESIVEMNNLPSGDKTPTMKYDTGKSGGTMKYDTGKSTGKSVYKKGPDGRPSPYQPM